MKLSQTAFVCLTYRTQANIICTTCMHTFTIVISCARATLPPLSLSKQKIILNQLLRASILVIQCIVSRGDLILVRCFYCGLLSWATELQVDNIYPRKNVKQFSSKFICLVYHSLFILKTFFVRQVNSVFCWTN